jgi:hypothetical protein
MRVGPLLGYNVAASWGIWMKKLAIGCLVVVVVAGAALVGIGYYGYLKVRSTVSQLAELGKVGDIEKDVRVKAAFVPPASGELTGRQVNVLMQIQQRVHDRLGENMAILDRKYQALAQKKDATVVDAPQILSAYRDLAATLLDAKRAQVEGLNEAGMSLDEYRWIKAEAYRALDVPFMEVDFGRLAQQAMTSAGPIAEAPVVPHSTSPAAPANRKLVEPYRKKLENYLGLASFGL